MARQFSIRDLESVERLIADYEQRRQVEFTRKSLSYTEASGISPEEKERRKGQVAFSRQLLSAFPSHIEAKPMVFEAVFCAQEGEDQALADVMEMVSPIPKGALPYTQEQVNRAFAQCNWWVCGYDQVNPNKILVVTLCFHNRVLLVLPSCKGLGQAEDLSVPKITEKALVALQLLVDRGDLPTGRKKDHPPGLPLVKQLTVDLAGQGTWLTRLIAELGLSQTQ